MQEVINSGTAAGAEGLENAARRGQTHHTLESILMMVEAGLLCRRRTSYAGGAPHIQEAHLLCRRLPLDSLLSKVAHSSFEPKTKRQKKTAANNSKRRLVNKFSKHSQWPHPYMAEIRVLDMKKQTQVVQEIAIMLPHEHVETLARLGNLAVLRQKTGLDPISLSHLEEIEAKLGCPVLGLGVWGDGVPCNWDRSQSLDCISLNIPGLAGRWKNLRLPLTCLNHKQWCYEAMCERVGANCKFSDWLWPPLEEAIVPI